MGFGTLVQALGELKLYAVDKDFIIRIGQLGKSVVRLGPIGSTKLLQTGAISTIAAPTVSPAYLGVGYVIGPELAALNFSGSVLAWGLLVPLFMYFLGAQLEYVIPAEAGEGGWGDASGNRMALHRCDPSL